MRYLLELSGKNRTKKRIVVRFSFLSDSQKNYCDSLGKRLVIESGSSPGSQNERHITSLSLCGNKHNCGWNDNVTPGMCCNVGRHTPTRAEPVRRLEQRAPSYTANGVHYRTAVYITGRMRVCPIMDAYTNCRAAILTDLTALVQMTLKLEQIIRVNLLTVHGSVRPVSN